MSQDPQLLLSRRPVLALLGAALAGSPVTAFAEPAAALPERDILALGRAVMSSGTVDRGRDVLRARLSARLGDLESGATELCARAMSEAARMDFADGETVRVDGVVFARVEAEALALLALEAGLEEEGGA